MHNPLASSAPRSRPGGSTSPAPRALLAPEPECPSAPRTCACPASACRPACPRAVHARLLRAQPRSQRPPARACCAQLPSPSVQFLYCDTISQLNPAASVTIQKLYRDTLPSQPVIQSCNTSPPSLQYKLVYWNPQFSSPAFSIAIQYNPCNTISP